MVTSELRRRKSRDSGELGGDRRCWQGRAALLLKHAEEMAQADGRRSERGRNAADLIHLPTYHFYIRLMVNGALSWPFSAKAMMMPTSG